MTAGHPGKPVVSQYIATAETLRRLQIAAAQAQQRGAVTEANRLLQEALALRPADPDAWFARGTLLQQLGVLENAVEAYDEALRVRPGFPEALSNQAVALRGLRRLEEAQRSADRAIALRPAYPRALNNRGLIALDAGHGVAAIEDFRRALALEPKFPEALHNLATALMQLRRYGEAREAFAALGSSFPHASGNALFAQLCDCDWQEYETLCAKVIAAAGRGVHAATPMSLLSVTGSAAVQLCCAQAHTEAFYPFAGNDVAVRMRPQDAKIRVGYLSGDLGEHAVSYLLAGVLERHDRGRFEVFAFAWGRRAEGEIRQRLERAVTHFIPIDALADAAVVRLMRDTGIDIAIDLCGHTEGQRTAIFAQRAAPIQVNFLGLPATMGASYMDYLIADPFLIPEGLDGHYAEHIVRLEGGFQPNDNGRPPVPWPPPRAALGLPDNALVLCSFNRSSKISPAMFSTWLRLLEALPDAVLWLLATHPAVTENLRREAARRGIAPVRLVFAGQVGYAEYLARYAHADLFLDTAPFNGGATVSDALSMGVPVVTLAGESFAGRMAGSCLQALGCANLITGSLAEYEATVLALAQDPSQLRDLRVRLIKARREHPFFDTDRYRVQLEAAYIHMVSRAATGQPPVSFTVAGTAVTDQTVST